MPFTPESISSFLNERTGGFSCPICKRCEWFIKSDRDGFVAETDALNGPIATGMLAAVEQFNQENGFSDPGDPSENSNDVLEHAVVIRCNHCGWIGLFDSEFISEKLNEQK